MVTALQSTRGGIAYIAVTYLIAHRIAAASIKNAAGERNTDFIDATGMATALLGDSIAANLFILGFTYQKSLIPLGFDAIERAIELNGVSIEMNKHALAWGRLAAHDYEKVAALVRPARSQTPPPGARRTAISPSTKLPSVAAAARFSVVAGAAEAAAEAAA